MRSKDLAEGKLQDLGSAEGPVVNDYFVDQSIEVLAIDGKITADDKRIAITSVACRSKRPRCHLQTIDINVHIGSVTDTSDMVPGPGPVGIREGQCLRSGRSPQREVTVGHKTDLRDVVLPEQIHLLGNC